MTPNTTSASANLECAAPVPVTGGVIVATLAGKSVTTFVTCRALVR
jgi:O-glycosyl hydrolase